MAFNVLSNLLFGNLPHSGAEVAVRLHMPSHYDGLYRLTGAEYSTGEHFGYAIKVWYQHLTALNTILRIAWL